MDSKSFNTPEEKNGREIINKLTIRTMKKYMRGDNPENMNPWVLIYHLK
jgi:hypothetical protein